MDLKEKRLEALFAPTVTQLGFELWGVEYLSQGKRSMLRVYIDSEQGISVDDCATVSRQISDLLDVADEIKQEYTLEVSSPGLDRTFFCGEQFSAFIGQDIDVRLNFPFEGKKRIQGRLHAFEDGEVVVHIDDDEYLLPFENIRKAKLVPSFEVQKAK